MELPVVDNEFLSLFIPDNSEFSTDDVIEEFKFYIFRLMNLTVDSLIQEQINNDYENNLLRKSFKAFFHEKLNILIDINSLYSETRNKIDLIKLQINKNNSIIDSNKQFASEHQELSSLYKNVQVNKLLLANKNPVFLHLLSIPSYMVNCIKNNTLDLYLEYYQYLLKINSNSIVIKNIKNVAEKINSCLVNLLKKILQQNSTYNFKLEEINDILEFRFYQVLNSFLNEVNYAELKKINVIIYQFFVFFKYLNLDKNETNFKKIKQFFAFSQEKIVLLESISINNQNLLINLLEYLLINFFIPIVKNSLFQNLKNFEKFKKRKEFIMNFFTEFIQIENSSLKIIFPKLTNLSEIEKLIIDNFFIYFDNTLKINKTNLKKYLSTIKDIKKLVTIDSFYIEKESFINYDILVILNNNLNEIFSNIQEISGLIETNIKYKLQIINKVNSHLDSEVLQMIQNFFEDNLYILLYDSFTKEIDEFRSQALNILLDFFKDLYNSLSVVKLWEEKEKLKKLKTFESFLNSELEEIAPKNT